MAREKFFSKYKNEEIEALLEDYDDRSFVLYYDSTARLYRFFRTEARKNLWVQAHEGLIEMTPEIASYEFTEAFTAPAPYTLNVNSVRDNQYVLYGSTGVFLEYSFGTVDGNGGAVNEAVDAYYTFRSPSGTITASNIYSAGTQVKMNIDEYLFLGTNSITILLRGRSTGVTRTVVVTYFVVQLDIESTFNISRSIVNGSKFDVTYTVRGAADKTVEFYIDGQPAGNKYISSIEPISTKVQTFSSSVYGPGLHHLQIQANMMAGDSQFYSKILYYEFVITGNELTTTMIKAEFPNTRSIIGAGSLPGLTGEQYVTSIIDWAYYSSDPLKKQATVQWKLYDNGGGETTLATRTADVVEAETDKMPDPLSFMPTEYGDYRLEAYVTGIEDPIQSYTISVIKNTAGIIEASDNLTMKLSGLGRSNEEPADTLTDWSNRGYKATFFNQLWNANSGWNNDAMCLNNGATCIINNKPFASEIEPSGHNGIVVEVDFETYNIDDENAVLFRIGNDDGDDGPSLVITSNKATLTSNNGTSAYTRFKSDERVKIAFVVYPKDKFEYAKKIIIFSNGVISGVSNYDEADNFAIGRASDSSSNVGMINIGNSESKGGIKIYYLRTYNVVIDMYEELNNFFIDSGENLQRFVARNDIYTTGTKRIDVDKLESLITTVKFTGPLDELINRGASKGKISSSMEVLSPSNPEINITCELAELSNAGQSTLDKPVPSLHVKLDKNGNICYDRDGKILPKNRWAFRTGNVPEKKFRLQANYMESSGCHNAAFFRLLNEVAPKTKISVDGSEKYVLRMPAENYAIDNYPAAMRQKYGDDPSGNNWAFPYNMHMFPDSIPCVVVWRKTDNDPYQFLGQYVMMEEKKSNYANGMHSIYDGVGENMNPDPFGFLSSKSETRLWDNSNCHQYELLTSTDDLTLFLDDSDWQNELSRLLNDSGKYFELVYPDFDDLETIEEKIYEWTKVYTEFIKPICDSAKLSTQAEKQAAFDRLYASVFDRWQWAMYYCLAMRNCTSDSMARNIELTTYDGVHYLPKWWDVDMQCGLYQTGDCILEPTSTRSTLAPGKGGEYAFSGRAWEGGVLKSSWLWDGLEGCSQFMEDVKKMDAALYNAGWTYGQITRIQDEEYVDKWSESLYNESGIAKYLSYNELINAQGSRTSHRHWFLKTSYDYFDAINVCGEYTAKVIKVRTVIPSGTKIRFKAGATSYFGWGTSISVDYSGLHVEKGQDSSMTINRTLQYNNPLHIYAANKIEEIDFSEASRYFAADFDLESTYDSVTGTLLKKVNIGIPMSDMHDGVFNQFTTMNVIGGIEYLSKVTDLNIQGLYYMTQLNMSGLQSLNNLYAAGTGLTSFTPASGTTFLHVELPTTVKTITMDGCSLTVPDASCAITWYDTSIGDIPEMLFDTSSGTTIPTGNYTRGPVDVEMTDISSNITYMRFTGMGYDEGTRNLIVGWIRKMAALNSPNIFKDLTLYCTNVYWDNFDVEDLLNIGKIGALTLTGYIKCNTEFTTEQMNQLMGYFGTNIFNLNNTICIDCIANTTKISASGPNTIVHADTGIIEVLQGTEAQFTAVGFPIVSGDQTYTWYVGTKTGTSTSPEIEFGSDAVRKHKLNYRTGLMRTAECNASIDQQFTVSVQTSSGGSGEVNVLVTRRTYPSHGSVVLLDRTDVDVVEGVYQIKDEGWYKFGVSYDSSYTGTLEDSSNYSELWEIIDFDDSYVTQITYGIDFVEMSLEGFPQDEYNMSIKYTSKWKNGSTVTVTVADICLVKNLPHALGVSSINGNPGLFSALEAYGSPHSDANYYSSFELKQVTGDLHIKNLIEDSSRGVDVGSLVDVCSGDQSERYSVLTYFKNVDEFDFTDCYNLGGDIDVSKCKSLSSILFGGTDTSNIEFIDGQQITYCSYAHPTKIEMVDMDRLIMSGADASTGYVKRTHVPYDSSGTTLYEGFATNGPERYGLDSEYENCGIVAGNVTIDDVTGINEIDIVYHGNSAYNLGVIAAISDVQENQDLREIDELDDSDIYLVGEYGSFSIVGTEWVYNGNNNVKYRIPVSEYDYESAVHESSTFNTYKIEGTCSTIDGRKYMNETSIVARMLPYTEVLSILKGSDSSLALHYANQMGFSSVSDAIEKCDIDSTGTVLRTRLWRRDTVDSQIENRITIPYADECVLYCKDLNEIFDESQGFRNAVGIVEVRSSRDLSKEPVRFGVCMVGGAHRIPAEYQEVYWLESDGSQFVDTSLTAVSGFKIETDIYDSSTLMNNGRRLAGCSTSGAALNEIAIANNQIMVCVGPTNAYRYGEILPYRWYHVEISNANNYIDCSVNGESVVLNDWAPTGSGTLAYSNQKIYIFNRNNSGSADYPFKGRMKDIVLEISGTHYEYIPCYRKSDGVTGLYEMHDQIFRPGSANFSYKCNPVE